MRRAVVALLTALTFACTTVRAPAGAFGDRLESLSGSIADPQVDLWVESGKPVSDADLARAHDEAREALRVALGGREVAPDALGAAEPLLVARARAVARTGSRRSDQHAAVAGIVIGFAVVIVVVVALVVLSKDSPRPPRATPARGVASAAGTAPTRVRVAAPARAAPPRLAPGALRAGAAAAPRLAPAPRAAPGGFPRAPAPWPSRDLAPYRYDSGPNVFVGLDFVWLWPPPAPPYVVAPGYASPDLDGGPYAGSAPYGAPPPAPGAPAPPEWGPAEEPAPAPGDAAPANPAPVELALPPVPELPLESRGFFAGDETVLELDLVDQRTGQLLWSKVVREEIDPRDARAVRRLVDAALAGQPWARRPPAPAAPRG